MMNKFAVDRAVKEKVKLWRLQRTVDRHNKDISDLEASIHSLTDAKEEAQQNIATLKGLLHELESVNKAEEEKLGHDIDTVRKEYGLLMDCMKEKVNSTSEYATKAAIRHKSAEACLQSRREKINLFSNYRNTELPVLVERLAERTGEVKKIQSKLNELISRRRDASSVLDNEMQLLSEAKREYNDLKAKLAQQQASVDKVQKRFSVATKALEVFKSERERDLQIIHTLEEEADAMVPQIQEMNKQREGECNRVRELIEKIGTLKKQVQKLNSTAAMLQSMDTSCEPPAKDKEATVRHNS